MAEMESLSLNAAYEFAERLGHKKDVDVIRAMEIEWDLSYTSTLRRGYIVELFEKLGIFEQFKKECWPFGITPGGERKRQRYLRVKKRYEDFLGGKVSEGSPSESDSDGGEGDEEQQFAAEADLRDFLAKNPSRIEKGLELFKDGDKDGVEYSVDSGFIDLLTLDQDRNFVVVELKLGKGRNKALGQLLYYMGWIDANFARAKPCRGMIIAKDIPEELVLAAKRVPGVSLFRYNLSVSVEKVA